MSALETIRARTNKTPVPVATPEWPELDGTVHVRRLSGLDRAAVIDTAIAQNATKGAAFHAVVCCHCAVDASGNRLFAGGDWQALAADAGSGAAVDRISETADKVNVITDRYRSNPA